MSPKWSVGPSKKLLARKFRKTVKTFTKKLSDYIDDPNEDNIHDIRIAIRRLESVHRIMPKGNRRRADLQSYVKMAKALFKINTQIRDFDIFRAKLEGNGHSRFDFMTGPISDKRKSQLVAGHRLALKLKNTPPPKLKVSEIREYRLRKRFRKIVSGLAADINRNIPLVLGDEKKIEEIHKLRKDFKKLRYSIEVSSDDAGSSVPVRRLKKIQDELGLIHDSDMFLDYLRGFEGTHDLSEIIGSETSSRRERYQKFVLAFRREKFDAAKLVS